MEKYSRITEGRATIFTYPSTQYLDKFGRPAPWKAPVFYNPAGKTTRDLSVALSSCTGRKIRMLDAMCGTGVRGIRVALEANADRVVLNDINPEAIALALLSSKENGVSDRVDLQSMGTNALCALSDYSQGYDYVDIDAFGSCAPFVQNGLVAAANGGMLAACSTD
ncbi:MAG: tRNA (guanine(10)-N(2))-dimethyltransferase, partial [Thermoprotei archaeon]